MAEAEEEEAAVVVAEADPRKVSTTVERSKGVMYAVGISALLGDWRKWPFTV